MSGILTQFGERLDARGGTRAHRRRQPGTRVWVTRSSVSPLAEWECHPLGWGRSRRRFRLTRAPDVASGWARVWLEDVERGRPPRRSSCSPPTRPPPTRSSTQPRLRRSRSGSASGSQRRRRGQGSRPLAGPAAANARSAAAGLEADRGLVSAVKVETDENGNPLRLLATDLSDRSPNSAGDRSYGGSAGHDPGTRLPSAPLLLLGHQMLERRKQSRAEQRSRADHPRKIAAARLSRSPIT